MHNRDPRRWGDDEEETAAPRPWLKPVIGLAIFVILMAVLIMLPGCAGGSSSGNYHSTFRPATGQPGSAN